MLIVCIILVSLPFGPVYAREREAGDLHFLAAEWAYEVRDEDDYDPNLSGAFPKGEMAYAYLELAGFSLAYREGLAAYHVIIDVSLRTTWGLTLFKEAGLIEFESADDDPPDTLWFYIWVDIPRWAPAGTYVTVITARDEIGGYVLEEKRSIRIF